MYKGTTDRCHPFPLDWDITHSKKNIGLQRLVQSNIFIIPYVKNWREHFGEEKTALVIMDNFKGHITVQVDSLLEENNIHVSFLQLLQICLTHGYCCEYTSKRFLRRTLSIGMQRRLVSNLKIKILCLLSLNH